MDDWRRQIEGLPQVEKLFEELGTTVVKEVVKESLNAAAEMVRNELRHRVPVLTGNLVMRITTKHLKSLRNESVDAILIGASVDGKPISARDIRRAAWNERRAMIQQSIDRPAKYIEFLERGWYTGKRSGPNSHKALVGRVIPHWGAPRSGRTFVPPHPVVLPSFDKVAPKVPAIFAENFSKRINALRGVA